MNEVTLIVSISFLVPGIMEIILSVPLILEKVKPNILYGFRVKKTLSNKEIWYKANKYMGRDMLVAGLILSIGSIGFFVFEMDIMTIAIIGLLLVAAPLVIMIVRAFIYLKKL